MNFWPVAQVKLSDRATCHLVHTVRKETLAAVKFSEFVAKLIGGTKFGESSYAQTNNYITKLQHNFRAYYVAIACDKALNINAIGSYMGSSYVVINL